MFSSTRYVSACLLAAGLFATPACASQGYYGYPTTRYPNYREVQRRAYQNGYEEGFVRGERDARGRRDHSYSRDREYHRGDAGYRRSDGDLNTYRRVFRQGYEVGYSEGYNRVARNYGYGSPNGRYGYPSGPTYGNQYPGGPRGYGSLAVQNGYRDGYEQGREDARDRDRYDPRATKRYREGDHDYDNRYGSRDEYKREYRAAFQQGYDEGFRSTGRRY